MEQVRVFVLSNISADFLAAVNYLGTIDVNKIRDKATVKY